MSSSEFPSSLRDYLSYKRMLLSGKIRGEHSVSFVLVDADKYDPDFKAHATMSDLTGMVTEPELVEPDDKQWPSGTVRGTALVLHPGSFYIIFCMGEGLPDDPLLALLGGRQPYLAMTVGPGTVLDFEIEPPVWDF